jgi:hypothetical protein
VQFPFMKVKRQVAFGANLTEEEQDRHK